MTTRFFNLAPNDRPHDPPFFDTVSLRQFRHEERGYQAQRFESVDFVETYLRQAFHTHWRESLRYQGGREFIDVPDALAFDLVASWTQGGRDDSRAFALDASRKFGPITSHMVRYSLAPGEGRGVRVSDSLRESFSGMLNLSARKSDGELLVQYLGQEEVDRSKERALIRAILDPEINGHWFTAPLSEWTSALTTLSMFVEMSHLLAGSDEELLGRVCDRFGKSHLRIGESLGLNTGFVDIGLELGEKEDARAVRSRFRQYFTGQASEALAKHATPWPSETGFEFAPVSLYGALLVQVVERGVRGLELGNCHNCGTYFLIKGKAVGKGKMYCGKRCQVAAHRARKKKSGG